MLPRCRMTTIALSLLLALPALVAAAPDSTKSARPTAPPSSVARTTVRYVGPNPAHGPARVDYTLAQPAHVHLTLHDVTGRVISVLEDRDLPAGDHVTGFAWKDGSGRDLASGIYWVRFQAGVVHLGRRIIFVR